MDQLRSRRTRRKRGHAVVEMALLSPWILFLFAGALDIGFYSQALTATQNAARVAAEYTSKNANTAADSTAACQYALDELSVMHNVRNLSTCGAAPLTVTATLVTGPDGASASSVSVTYKTEQLIPIPGLAGQFTITRTVEMRLQTS